ncbi:MAG: tetratricopeptide repeat protein [Deltaproteobacteria bacterium]|nr:tetratricopeptide repeat protein [Deltaproteobacteria bacterium]
MKRHPGFLNWKEYILDLEERAAALEDSAESAAIQMDVARVWEDKFLDKGRAILHYQKAFKMDASNADALQAARRLYWEMGRLGTIERLVTLELQLTDDSSKQAALYRDLAESMLMLGELDRAELACMECMGRAPDDSWNSDVIDDLSAGDAWRERAADLEQAQGDGLEVAQQLFRAAMLHRGGGSSGEIVEGLLQRAVEADPHYRPAVILYEKMLADVDRKDELVAFHEQTINAAVTEEQNRLRFAIGRSWLLVHQDPARAVPFIDEALRRDPGLPGLLGFPYEYYIENGEAEKAVTLLTAALENAGDEELRIDILELAGDLHSRVLTNPDQAAKYFNELRGLDPDNALAGKFFEENEMTMDGGSDDNKDRDETVDDAIESEEETVTPEEESPEEPADDGTAEAEPVEEEPAEGPDDEFVLDRSVPSELEEGIAAARAAESEGADKGIAAWQSAWATVPGHPEVVDALVRLFSETEKWHSLADFLKKQTNSIANEPYKVNALMTLAGLYDEHLKQDVMVVNTYQSIIKVKADYLPAIDAAAIKYEAMGRWPDLVKILKVKGSAVTSPEDKVEVYLQVAQLFLQRFSNQAEAIKAFEEVVAADPTHEQALEFLKDMYEKRRDWEKLTGVMQREAERLPDGPERVEGFVKIAELTTERLKRPAICVERWESVLELDPEHEAALKNLAGLYERTKEWEKFAGVLDKQLESVVDASERVPMLQKLGQVYGDKIGDDTKAVEAWKALIEIQPDDRRAQEQLKKRYLAMHAWDELEDFYGSTGKWDEFIRVLEREADKSGTEAEAKVSMQFKIAELWQEKKSRVDRAARCYEAVLAIDPDNLKAAEALIPILEEGKDPAKLVDVLEVRLRHLDDAVEKLELLQRIARIAEDEIGDADRAFNGFLEAFKLASDDTTTLDDMERAAEKAGKWEEVVDAYKAVLEQAGDAADIELKLRVARVIDEEVKQPEEALTYYDSILAEDSKNPRAVSALEKIYAQMGRYEELLDIYTRRLEMAEDEDERKEILYNQALLWEEEVGDAQKAIDVLLQIIEMAGDEARALTALDRLYSNEERWTDLVDILQRALDQGALDAEAEIDLKYRLGQVSDAQLGDRARALECYREILAIVPDHLEALSALETLLEDENQQAEAALILTPFYEEGEEWEKLVSTLEILVKHGDDDFEKYENLLKIGEIFGRQLGTPERAFVAYSRAFRTNPIDPRALELLEEITAILDSWGELVGLLEEGGQSAQDSDVVRDLWLRAARIHDTQLDDADQAINAYHKALEADSQNIEAVEALEQIFNRTERWEDLVKIYQVKVDLTMDAGDKEQIYLQMAMILEEMLEKPEEAVSCLKEILSFDPTNGGALKALDKLLVELERWTDLADNLQQQLSLGEDEDDTMRLKLRLAALRETKLDEVGAAIETYREVLEFDASNEKAIEALERIIENQEFRRDVADILEPIYRAVGEWEKLIGVYEIIIEEDDEPARKVDLLHQISSLYETAGDEPEQSFKTLGRALAVDPADERTLEDLERLAQVLVLYDDLAALYTKTVEGMENMDLAAAYHFKVARIYEVQIQDVDSAITHYRKVLEIDPMHLEAATALEGAYQISENYEELAITYLKKVEMVTDPDEQKELLFKASQIYEDIFENSDKAIEVYMRVLDIDEDDLNAISHLEVLYLKLERWDDLQEIYNRKVDLVETPEEKREVLYVLGAMYEQEVQDVRKAIETYQRILEFDPDDIQAIQRLDVLFTETEEWHDMLSILEREVELAEDPDEVISFKYRIGELYVKHLDDVMRAVEYFREILSISPEHQPSTRALEELIENNNEPLLVAEVLEPLYQEFGEWRKLIGVIEVKIKNTDDAWQRVELLHQVAEMLESDLHLDSPGEAFDVYAKALGEDRVNEKTLMHLENLADQTGRWEDLAKLFDAQLEDVVEAEHAIQLGLRDGAIYEDKLGRHEEAIERYRKVLEFDSENRPALFRLDELFQGQERWEDLTSILQQEALVVDDPEKSLDIQFRLGQVYQQELEEVDKAIDVYRDILAAEPAHESSANALEFLFAEGIKRTEIGEVLEPLYRMQAEWERLVHLYEAQLEDVEDVQDKISMMHRIAEIQEERVLDAVEAFTWYCRAFSTDPFDERSGEEVGRLAESTDAWSDLADLYQDLFTGSEDEDVRRTCAKKLARVAEEKLADIARAEQAYRGCLELGGDDLDVLNALDRIYTQYMEWERLVEILAMIAEVTPSEGDKIETIHRMGAIYETQLDEFDKARECFHKVVDDLEPGHRGSLEHLEIIYADREAWSELYDVYTRMKDASESEAVQADLFAKLATIAADCLEDTDKAIELWGNVLDIRGEDPLALESLADLYARDENWSDLVDVLERAVIIVEDDESRVRIYSQLGLVWGECLERDRSALENWENVLAIDPENIPALKAIAKIHEANQEWGMLIETIERIISVGAAQLESDELKGYYAKLGTIFSETLEQPVEALDAWRHATDVDPTDVEPLKALEKLYSDQAMWEELIEVLGSKGDLLDGDEQLDAYLEQAKAYEEKLDEPLRAKESYARILEVAPLHEHAFERLVEIETEEENWEELTEFYFNRLNYVSEIRERVKIYHDAALVYEDKLSQPENAFVVMQRAFEEDYSSDDTADHLERLASVTGKWDELLASSNQVLQTVDDKHIQINLCLKIGKWYADELGHPEYAIAYYQQVLQLDPDNVAALKLMGDLYRGTKQWNELVEVLQRAVDREEDEENRKNLYVDLGEIYEEYLKDVPQARSAYKSALDLDPSLETAINALERLFGAAQNWRELIPILRRKIEVLSEDPDAVVATHLRIGEILEDNLDDTQAALDEYREILEVDEGHLPALKGLERLYNKLERWQDLMDILEIQLEYATSERERITLFTRIAEMLEKEFVKPDKAAERYEQVLDIDPTHIESLEALERLYRQIGQWQDLIGTLERHIDALPERSQRVEYYKQIAEVYSTEIDDPERAIDAYTEILDIEPENEDALDQLARLQTKKEDWSAAHDMLQRLAETVADPDRKIDLYFRLGKLNEENLMNRGVAVEHFRSALDVEPGHLPSLAALRKIHVDEGEWIDATRVLEAEQEYTDQARTQSKLQYELGAIFADKLGDEESAVKWYEDALKSDPDNQQAAEPLVDVYIKMERWDEAEPLLDMLVRLGGKRPSEEMQPLHRKFALVADKQSNLDKALQGFQAAYELDSTHLPTVLCLADVHYRMEEWDKAFKFYQMVLVHHRDKQGKDEIVEIFYRLGNIKAQLKERRKALNMFDKALEIDTGHKLTLEAVIGLHEEQKNYDQVIHYKKILMDAVDDDERFELLTQVGDIWQQKLKNPQKAISSYTEAIELNPDNRPTLHKLLPLYQETKQWQKVVEIIGQVAEMEEDEDKLARLFYSMGVIFRDEIKSAEDAVERFNISLDHSLENLKAFEAIDRILTQRKDWKNLERNYRKMLHRIAGKDRQDLEINLWHFLGEIYRTRMGQYEPAAEAFKMAASLDPDNALRHEILAELYVSLPSRIDDAVAEYQWLIKKNPYHVDSYKALRKLYFDNRQYDKAWCLCATLSFLKKADAEEQQFFEQYRTRGMVRAQSRLDNERWLKDLFHVDESIYVGKVFEAVTRAVRSLKVQPIKAFGLKKNQKRPANDTITFSKTFFYAAQVLNLPVVPDLYIQEDRPGALNFAVTDPMATACGASLLSGYSPQDLLFIVAKHLTYYRPEHYIRWVLPTHGELKMLLLAAVKIGAPGFKLPEDKTGALDQYVGVLQQRLNPMEVETVSKVVRRFVKSGEVTDIKKWINAVELTGCRAGLLLANDLEVAARMIQAEAGTVDEIPPKEKIKDLVLFSVSEEYFRLREALGIVIGT